jgi:5-methylcytosine-specific restriction endonuclease McrA
MVKPYVPYDGPIISRAEALAQGLTRFFPGSRCRKAGHLSQRMTCSGGCAACLAIRSEVWQKANPEKMAAAIGAWYEANADYVREKSRLYSKAHQPESAAARRRRRAEKLAAKLAARVPDPADYTGPVITREEARAAGLTRFFTGKPCARNHMSQRTTANGGCFRCNTDDGKALYHVEGPEKRSVRQSNNRAWKKTNPEKVRVDSQRRRASVRAAEGSHTADELKALFQRQNGKCAYCSKSIRNGYHVDHVISLARGGSNWITNIALACAPCNTAKGATDPIDFARRIGRLL